MCLEERLTLPIRELRTDRRCGEVESTGDAGLEWSDGRERLTPVSVGEKLYSASTANFVRKLQSYCSWWGLETDFFKDVFKDRNNGLFVC